MAGVIRNSLFSLAKKVTTPVSAHILQSKQALACMRSPHTGIVSRNVTRSLWYMSSRNDGPSSPVPKLVPHATHRCGCGCQLHTEVDGAISKFLEKEIKLEESSKSNKQLPKVKDFSLGKSDGSSFELTKDNGNERITVKCNVNGSVDSAHPVENQSQDEPTDMVAKPSFTVEINKGGNEVLAIECYFPTDEGMLEEGQDGEPLEDLFEIQEVALYSGEWNESVYSLQAETMDGNLYDLFMDMLDERGVDDEFVHSLINFSTVYEHGKYVGFLKDMKTFVDRN